MRFSDTDVAALVDILKQAGTSEIVPRFRQMSDTDIKQKTASWDVVKDSISIG